MFNSNNSQYIYSPIFKSSQYSQDLGQVKIINNATEERITLILPADSKLQELQFKGLENIDLHHIANQVETMFIDVFGHLPKEVYPTNMVLTLIKYNDKYELGSYLNIKSYSYLEFEDKLLTYIQKSEPNYKLSTYLRHNISKHIDANRLIYVSELRGKNTNIFQISRVFTNSIFEGKGLASYNHKIALETYNAIHSETQNYVLWEARSGDVEDYQKLDINIKNYLLDYYCEKIDGKLLCEYIDGVAKPLCFNQGGRYLNTVIIKSI
jgi:hypothetical protein